MGGIILAFLIITAFRVLQEIIPQLQIRDPRQAEIRAAVLKRLDELEQAEQDRLSSGEHKGG